MQHESINRPPQGQGKSKGKTLQQKIIVIASAIVQE